MNSERLNGLRDAGLLLIRVVLGVVFLFHGSQKLFGSFQGAGLPGFTQFVATLPIPYPAYAAVLAAAAEFLGGLALISGYAMRIMMLPLAATMGVAAYFVHRGAFSIQDNGMEYPLTLGVVAVGLALTGPGRLTLPGLVESILRIVPSFPRVSLPSMKRRPAKFRTDSVVSDAT